MFSCKICQKSYDTVGPLHSHLKKVHSLSQKDYYYYWYPRLDLNDGSLIEYKNFEQYFSSLFNSRLSFSEWCQNEVNYVDARSYIKNELKRKFDSGYKFYPSQSEIKSMMLPSYFWISKIFGGIRNFLEFTSDIGLALKFDYLDLGLSLDSSEMSIITDTREQRPLFLPTESRISKLPVGDYCCEGEMYSGVYIERKSLMDLAGTLTSGIERFEKEISKAKELGLYLVVVCDEPHIDCMEYSPANSFAKRVTGAHLFHEIRRLCQKYDNIQFTFCSDRRRAKQLIETIFRLGNKARNLDIEFLKDLRKI